MSLRRDGDLCWLSLPRATGQVVDPGMVENLDARLTEAGQRPGILVVASATPGAFVTAAEVPEPRHTEPFDAEPPDAEPPDAEPLDPADVAGLSAFARALERLEAHRWPTIALVDGPALGAGCELALACDFRIASPAAQFGQPTLSAGVIAGAGAHGRLARLVGLGLARRMLLAGARLDARAALAAGLVDEVTEDLDHGARGLAHRLTQRSWRALELGKVALRRPAETTFDVILEALLFDRAADDD